MTVSEIITLSGEVLALIGSITACVLSISKVMNGTKCLLRSEMLRIYYRHKDAGEIRQYEYENFVYLYEAYKKLKGNSFIDKIYKEIQGFKINS